MPNPSPQELDRAYRNSLHREVHLRHRNTDLEVSLLRTQGRLRALIQEIDVVIETNRRENQRHATNAAIEQHDHQHPPIIRK